MIRHREQGPGQSSGWIATTRIALIFSLAIVVVCSILLLGTSKEEGIPSGAILCFVAEGLAIVSIGMVATLRRNGATRFGALGVIIVLVLVGVGIGLLSWIGDFQFNWRSYFTSALGVFLLIGATGIFIAYLLGRISRQR